MKLVLEINLDALDENYLAARMITESLAKTLTTGAWAGEQNAEMVDPRKGSMVLARVTKSSEPFDATPQITAPKMCSRATTPEDFESIQ